MSAMLKSTSWPTALTTGSSLAAIARATISSLKAHRSSSEPPPRPTIRASRATLPSRCQRLARSMASAISRAAPSPWTATGRIETWMEGQRRARTVRISWMAAPVGEVMTPRCEAASGRGRLRAWSNRPSLSSRALSFSKAACSAPAPACSMCSTINWNSPRPSYRETRARRRMASPLPGRNFTRWLRPLNMAQRTWASPSLSEKYQCPEEGHTKLLISPSTQTKSKWLSSRIRAWRLRSLTLSSTGGSAGSNGLLKVSCPGMEVFGLAAGHSTVIIVSEGASSYNRPLNSSASAGDQPYAANRPGSPHF